MRLAFLFTFDIMALFKPSSLISEIRGKIGGNIFQISPAGNIVRSLKTPINRRTIAQTRSRHFTNNVLQKWIELTDSQRKIWDAYTEYNPTQQKRSPGLFISGQQTFIKYNKYRLEYDLPFLITPIFNKCDLTAITLTLTSDGAILTITVDRNPIPADEFIVLSLTVRYRSSINNPGSRYKLINFITTAAASYDITSEYVNIFGRVPQPGETIFMKYTNISKLSGKLFPFKFEKVLL